MCIEKKISIVFLDDHTWIFRWDANRDSTSFIYIYIIVLSDKNFHNSEFKDTKGNENNLYG